VTSNAAIRVSDLSLAIGGAKIVDGVTLEVKPGELLGVIGPNGAGKTSLFNLISGLRPATRGKIYLGDDDITDESPASRASKGLGRTFQTSSVFTLLPVLENVRLAAEAAMGGSMKITRRAYSFKPAIAKAEEALNAVGLSDKRFTPAGALSHGDKRRLEIAIVLASDAKVVMLDEPMAGMSVENVPVLIEIIRSLSRDYGRTVLMVEHHMHVVLGLADRIAVMHQGELLICADPQTVISDPTVQSAYLGESL
jgi:branched-chain amino acid transport system ATP-binding protein